MDGVMRTKNQQKGFTLIELVIVVAIISILAVSGVRVADEMHLSSAARRLYGVIMQGKGEAVKRNAFCTLVFNQVVGPDTFRYVLFEDQNRNSEYDALPAPGEPIIARQQQWGKNIVINTQQGGGTGFTIPDNDDNLPSISFKPNSIPTANGGGIANGTIFLADSKFPDLDDRTTCIIINRSGNVRVTYYNTVLNQCQ